MNAYSNLKPFRNLNIISLEILEELDNILQI